MQLDERKMKILKCIIRLYLETGEPVGSRTISKDADLNVSSATIRNEMADLEELGLIIQPHTSAGRIPTDLGYRLYVDELMEEKEREVLDLKELMTKRMNQVEDVLKQMAKLLAANTQYATMISGPRYNENALKLIQLSRVDETHLVCVIVIEGNVVKNNVFEINEPISEQEVLKLNVLLNSTLQGLSLNEINLALIAKLKEQAGDYSGIVGQVLEYISETVSVSKEKMPEVYTSGATNIFKYPELTEGTKASEILSTFEEKEQLLSLVSDAEDKNEIQVYIGNETPVSTMKDCSVVTASYDLGKGVRGTIGIIGPKRMDYEHVFSTLKTVMEELDTVYNNKDDKN